MSYWSPLHAKPRDVVRVGDEAATLIRREGAVWLARTADGRVLRARVGQLCPGEVPMRN